MAPVPGLAPPPPSSSFAQFGNQSSQSRPPLTLEEVEAELRASRSQQQQQGPAPVTSGSDGRRALTLEEVEAQMLAQRSSQPPQLPPQQPAFNDFPPPPPQFQGLPPHISALLAQQPPNLSPQQREQLLGIQLQQLQQSGILGAGGPIGMANEGMGMGINGSAPTVQGGIQAPPPSSSEIRGSPAPQAQAPIPQQPSQRVGTPKSQQHKAQQSSSGGVGGILSNPSHFPPLGSNAPPTGPNLNSGRDAPPISNPLQQLMNGSAQAVQNRNGPMMGIGGLPLAPNQNQMNNLSNASANAALLQAQAAQEQNLRMRNLLNSLPKVLQSRLLNQIPPYVQFETLDLLVRNLPLLVGLTFDEEEEKLLNLQNELKEGKSLKEELEEKLLEGNREEIERFRIEGVLKKMEMLDNANRLVDSILKREDMRRKIAAKIQGMVSFPFVFLIELFPSCSLILTMESIFRSLHSIFLPITVSIQQSHDHFRQGFHHSYPSLPTSHSRSLRRRFLCSHLFRLERWRTWSCSGCSKCWYHFRKQIGTIKSKQRSSKRSKKR